MSFLTPKAPKVQVTQSPPPPTIDQAAMQDEQTRKYGRRKGSLATVFAGSSSPAPSVAVRTALGNSAGV